MDKKRPATAEWSTAKLRRVDAPSAFPLTHTTPGAGFRPRSLNTDAFTVGWICALEAELAASVAMLDEEFRNLPEIPGDSNTYTLGRMGDHNIVMVCLPAGTTGTNAAAMTATNMMRSFPKIRFGLMVGIGGGAPDEPSNDSRNDIRLGDVVVSCPTVDSSGVLQYDFGKTMKEGKFVQTGTLNKTHTELRTGISVLRARHRRGISQIPFHIDTMLQSNRKMRGYFDHPDGESSCEACDRGALLVRKPRADSDPAIHYGLIGSANQVMRHGMTREKLRKEKGILCFEMEAAGLMDILPCLVIRGICDYADSHKNKRWQPYAAAAAAAYAKEILSVIPPAEAPPIFPMNIDTIHNMLQSFISESSLEQLLQLLPAPEQSQRKSAIPDLDPRDHNFSWVFENIDYKSWRSNDSRFVLCLSSPLGHHLSQVTSYVVDQEQNANHPVLYCFCSKINNGEFIVNKGGQISEGQNIALASALIYTLLKQIIVLSPIEKRLLIMHNLFNSLLQKIFEKPPSQNWTENGFDGNDPFKGLHELLGNAATDDLLAVFQDILDYAKPQPTLIVLDGVEKAYQGGRFLHLIGVLINDLRRQSSNMKALLVGPTVCDITALSQESMFIEYDKELKECLFSLQFENTRYEKITPEQSGSFEWLWVHDEYKRWSNSETSRLLYIQGKPGSGKSTLTKYFDSNLPTREPAAKKAIVAKFFYSFREGEPQRSHYSMLLSLLHDILCQEKSFFYHYCQAEYRAHRCSGAKWDYQSLKRILGSLQDYYSTPKRFYIIIDAVDESEETDRRDILNMLYNLCSNIKYCVVKIFIASRPVAQLEARRDQFLDFIRLQDETTLDISNFANSLLNGLGLNREVAYMIGNAQGVFLWVKLVGEELLKFHEDGYSEHDIFLMLKKLPTELEELYGVMLDKMRTNKSCLSYGLKMFRFILFARRPLRVNELLHSLGIPDSTESDSISSLTDEIFEERVPLSERIIVSCGGNFIEIKQRNDGHRVVQVIHQTAFEFLRDPDGVVSKSAFRIDEGYAHMLIATTCIQYLMLCAASTSLRVGLPDSEHWIANHYDDYAKYLDKRPLAFYASHHVEYHVNRYMRYANQKSNTQKLAAQVTCDWINDPFNYLLESWSGSHLAPLISKKIQNKLIFASAKDHSARTPLSWAAGNGQESTMRLLLEEDANTNLPYDYYGQTPLSWAARNGHESIVRLLLENGAAINSKDESNRTPLSWAAKNGHAAIVELLQNNGATL
ncbi:ankyrin repeats (3 copies) domain-containing protein [Trichoderma breve]|uniref:Ankyrin repeats (3 copies) domain-containing protein n=1 Tax=Trichoderma breve TaxID=2034170 RepID=A0A9W9JQE6_9HYPO|nr:ankyrin repeats (3 copies) domain-containing protein [Trichoderma breve]KAJ4863715.1 ankyrin repeats (3 copies) domain-containing protein [Trichoderma breve]